jgi:hypothetical protein
MQPYLTPPCAQSLKLLYSPHLKYRYPATRLDVSIIPRVLHSKCTEGSVYTYSLLLRQWETSRFSRGLEAFESCVTFSKPSCFPSGSPFLIGTKQSATCSRQMSILPITRETIRDGRPFPHLNHPCFEESKLGHSKDWNCLLLSLKLLLNSR